ncbi:nuclear transport factor 2 family protein [Streptomyces ossamyceticus]|uniref:Nuclear transport factor 2 family protein n=1 Tax=Streptomyces ossamyceticus TaxID=249581 RepID=A0ABV2UV05_9ACTN
MTPAPLATPALRRAPDLGTAPDAARTASDASAAPDLGTVPGARTAPDAGTAPGARTGPDPLVRPDLPAPSAGEPVPASLYAGVQQFYARQMHLIEGAGADPDAWAETFTEDAVIELAGDTPDVGREAIRASVAAGVAHVAAQGWDFRHWFGMLDVRPREDGSLRTRYCALAMATPRGGALAVRGSLVCHDDLVRAPDGSGWLVRHRRLVPDGRPGD